MYENIIQSVKNLDNFGHGLLDISAVKCEEHYAKVQIKLSEKHMNAQGITHGGALFTLADTAAGLAFYTTGEKSVTLTTNMTYISISRVGETIYAEASLISSTKKFATYQITMHGEDGRLLATAQSIMYKKSIKTEGA
jgi:acyl-CoA thioesterase